MYTNSNLFVFVQKEGGASLFEIDKFATDADWIVTTISVALTVKIRCGATDWLAQLV